MHHTKHAARKLAWTDANNPFGKHTHRRQQQNRSSLRRAEEGAVLTQVSSAPHSATAGDRTRELVPGHDHPQANTWDAYSRPRANEPGNDVEFPASTSPRLSLENEIVSNSEDSRTRGIDLNEKHDGNPFVHSGSKSTSDSTKVDSSEAEPKHRRGFAKFLGGKKTDRAEEADDLNNGKEKKRFTFRSQIEATLLNSWINILLIACPVGIALHYAKVNDVAIFVVNFIAIIPLAAMLSYATEEIALRTGEVLGGLLNASFGNAVELIVSIIALTQDQVLIVKTSLIGSVLSNLLLVLGMCFFAGGVNRIEQAFNMTVAQTAASLLFLAVSSLIIPTTFNEWANTGSTDRTNSEAPIAAGEIELSRATAILLLLVYACYLFFQLKSHTKMYSAPSEKNETRDMSKQKRRLKSMVPRPMRKASKTPSNSDDEKDDEPEEPHLALWVAILTLLISTVFVALNAEFLVDSIDSITCGGAVSKNFVGLILLPIVGNAAEHATAVTVAIKDKMDLAIGVAVGSSMQIALLVLPLMVVLGWILGKDDMTLFFDGFQIAVLFVAVLLVNYLIQDGKSHWLEGVLLMVLYVIVAVAAWFYPTASELNDCPNK